MRGPAHAGPFFWSAAGTRWAAAVGDSPVGDFSDERHQLLFHELLADLRQRVIATLTATATRIAPRIAAVQSDGFCERSAEEGKMESTTHAAPARSSDADSSSRSLCRWLVYASAQTSAGWTAIIHTPREYGRAFRLYEAAGFYCRPDRRSSRTGSLRAFHGNRPCSKQETLPPLPPTSRRPWRRHGGWRRGYSTTAGAALRGG